MTIVQNDRRHASLCLELSLEDHKPLKSPANLEALFRLQ